ncbi:MAG: hypothetical protein WKF94_17780 [Solirubrobacteraceae bacterium]
MTPATAIREELADASTRRERGRHGRWIAEHRPFLIALALGAVVRVVVSLAFTPALMVSDGPRYLSFLDTFEPAQDRVVGYSLLLLYPLSLITESLLAVTVTQHLLGLATAVLLYVLLRRWGVAPFLATLATLPVLFDGMKLLLEHSMLSDTLFVLVVTAGIVVLGWRRRPTLPLALAAGLLLGTSVTVRQVGLPLVLAGVAFCVVAGRGWRVRLAPAAVFALAFMVPVGAYATWYHHEHGIYGLSEIAGKAAYMRTTSFVDCSGLSVPNYQRVLCPPEPRGQREDPTFYGWDDAGTAARLTPPPGTTSAEAMRAFADEAMKDQPVDYALVVLRDFALNFDVWRGDRFEFDTSHKWRFNLYVDREPDSWTRPAFEAHGGEQLSTHQPYATALAVYSWVGYIPGPVLLGCLVLGLMGGFGWGRARGSEVRAMCLLLIASGVILLLVPAVTTQFVWRYQLPGLALLPAGAALAFSALRGGGVAGTVATPSTD